MTAARPEAGRAACGLQPSWTHFVISSETKRGIIHTFLTGIGQVARCCASARDQEALRAVAQGRASAAVVRLYGVDQSLPAGGFRVNTFAPGGTIFDDNHLAIHIRDGGRNSGHYEELLASSRRSDGQVLLEADLIGSFHRTRSHGIRWKGFSPDGALDGVDLSTPSEERTRSLRQEINFMVAHSLHRHSESLVNTLERVALRVIQEIMSHQYSPSGPALGTHQGELLLQSRPPLPFALAAPEAPNSSAYVVYKIGGDPSDYQFLQDAPKEIPHGYTCAYVPDCSTWAPSNQVAIAGTWGNGRNVGADTRSNVATYATPSKTPEPSSAVGSGEKRAWLVKYATPTNLRVRHLQPRIKFYELIPLPPKYRLPDFTKFSGSDGSSSIEHVSRYLAQLGMISASDELRVRYFSQSLTGSAFGWYTSLPPNSIQTWKQLEERFHEQYHSRLPRLALPI
ncbi:hypothetical protein QYE76_067567 [Lolium multiflorum]|uniref:Retrotransposon gag domain-containing protein n=1 Tax=Lolium multiflorum TaxID=4521 RepID=A0AAD8SCU5_LOLMU|nr:hypothetical protein QYE76_067567 [Lolium multiflorum]